jgi:hypothetical protein
VRKIPRTLLLPSPMGRLAENLCTSFELMCESESERHVLDLSLNFEQRFGLGLEVIISIIDVK